MRSHSLGALLDIAKSVAYLTELAQLATRVVQVSTVSYHPPFCPKPRNIRTCLLAIYSLAVLAVFLCPFLVDFGGGGGGEWKG